MPGYHSGPLSSRLLSSKRAILFDFDYTLADSSDAVVLCFNAGLRGIGLPEADPVAIKRTIGLSIPEALVAVAGEEHLPREQEFRARWRALSNEIMVDMTRVYDAVPGTARSLAEGGYRLGVVSTKWRSRIEETFAREGLGAYFELVVGGDDVAVHKPDPEGLRQALDKMRLAPEDVVYVGDSIADGEAARRAGVAFVGVLTGMTERETLEQFAPLAVVGDVGALVGLTQS